MTIGEAFHPVENDCQAELERLCAGRHAAAVLRPLAENQPTTPVTESMRALLTGGPVAGHVSPALWLAGILTVGMVFAVFLFRSQQEMG